MARRGAEGAPGIRWDWSAALTLLRAELRAAPTNLGRSVGSAFRQCMKFSGRTGPSEYWWYVLFTLIVSVAAAIIDAYLFGTNWTISLYGYVTGNGPVSISCGVALLLPTLAATVRRLHDVRRSGWYLLFELLPFGSIVLLVTLAGRSDRDNRYGPAPTTA